MQGRKAKGPTWMAGLPKNIGVSVFFGGMWTMPTIVIEGGFLFDLLCYASFSWGEMDLTGPLLCANSTKSKQPATQIIISSKKEPSCSINLDPTNKYPRSPPNKASPFF